MDVVCDTDESQWIVLLDDNANNAQLIPVISLPETDKKLVLWNQKKFIHLKDVKNNFSFHDTVSYREFTDLVPGPLPR